MAHLTKGEGNNIANRNLYLLYYLLAKILLMYEGLTISLFSYQKQVTLQVFHLVDRTILVSWFKLC